MSQDNAHNTRKQKPVRRVIPPAEMTDEGVNWFCNRDQKPVTTTLIFKVHNPSRQTKVPRMRDAGIFATNLKHRILEHYRETLDAEREDGAIALVLRAQQLGKGRSQALGQIISTEYLQPRLSDEERRFHSRIHQGICTNTATLLLNWVQDIAGSIISRATLKADEDEAGAAEEVEPAEDHDPVTEEAGIAADRDPAAEAQTDAASSDQNQQKRSSVRKKLSRRKRATPLTVADVYAAWKQKRRLWEQAAAIPIPFGRHAGTRLGDIGKREARWLMERLLPLDEIDATLEFIEQLMEHPTLTMQDATDIEHPFQRDDGREFKHRRAVRTRRLVQRILDPPGDLILLGMLNNDELVSLRNELQSMRAAGEQFASLLPPFHEALQEARQLAEFADFKDQAFKNFAEVFEVFLYEKPDNYPEVAAVSFAEEHQNESQSTYETRLRWFHPNRERKDDMGKYIREDLERNAVARFLEAAEALAKPPKLQPVPFIGAARPPAYNDNKQRMNPAAYRDFALLFDEETYDLVAAVWIRGNKDRPSRAEERKRQEGLQQQKRRGKLRYVNFPETYFDQSDKSAYMLLPLEWGEQSNRRRFREKRQAMLKDIIARQAEKQRMRHAEISKSNPAVPLEACLPSEVPFSSAKLVFQWNNQGELDFFLHVSTTLPAEKPRQIPQTVIGFHEHNDGYSFAELKFDGTVVRVGDLQIPRHIDPAYGRQPSDNYVFEVVRAMLREAGQAYIGIEDTAWKADQPGLSHAKNRSIFGRPSGQIRNILQWKGRQLGILQPRMVTNVSHSRDCGQCTTRHPKGSNCVERRQFVRCPNDHCRQWQHWQADEARQQCSACQHTWRVNVATIIRESYFVCAACQKKALPARHNTAIVVAQEMLRQINPHYQNARKREEARLRRKAQEEERRRAEAEQAEHGEHAEPVAQALPRSGSAEAATDSIRPP